MTERQPLPPEKLRAGLTAFLTRLSIEYAKRAKAGEPHPAVVYVNPDAYAYFTEAMAQVADRIGIRPPQDELYSYKGILVRCSR